MQPESPQPTLPVILDYHDPLARGRPTLVRLVRCFAGALALAAFALAAGAVTQGWVQNRVLEFGVWLLVAVGAVLVLRAANLCKATFRPGWISAVIVFGLWAAIVLSNQTHGQPPPTDRYYIAGFGLTCVLSAFALAFDPAGRRGHDQRMA